MATTTQDPSQLSYAALYPSTNFFAMLRNFVNNGCNLSSLKSNFNNTTPVTGYATDTYVVGSAIPLGLPSNPLTSPIAGMRYNFVTDMVKTAAGTGALTITLRIGTTATISDPAILTFAFGAGTAAADTGTIELWAHFQTVGAGTTAVMVGVCSVWHALAATGLISTGAAGQGQITQTSAGFNTQVAGLVIGVSVNGGAAFSGTTTVVESQLQGY